jgi:hypothetical protein
MVDVCFWPDPAGMTVQKIRQQLGLSAENRFGFR